MCVSLLLRKRTGVITYDKIGRYALAGRSGDKAIPGLNMIDLITKYNSYATRCNLLSEGLSPTFRPRCVHEQMLRMNDCYVLVLIGQKFSDQCNDFGSIKTYRIIVLDFTSKLCKYWLDI